MDIFSLITTIAIYCSSPGICTKIINPEDNTRVRIEMCISSNLPKIDIGIINFNNPKEKVILTIVTKKCIEA